MEPILGYEEEGLVIRAMEAPEKVLVEGKAVGDG